MNQKIKIRFVWLPGKNKAKQCHRAKPCPCDSLFYIAGPCIPLYTTMLSSSGPATVQCLYQPAAAQGPQMRASEDRQCPCVCPQRGGLYALMMSAAVTLKDEFISHLFFPI